MIEVVRFREMPQIGAAEPGDCTVAATVAKPTLKIEELYRLKLGGTYDTLAISSLIGAGLFTSPALASSPLSPVVPLALAAMGGAWLTHRIIGNAQTKKVLKSELEIVSSESPAKMDPATGELYIPIDKAERQPCKGLLFGYTTDRGEPVFVDDNSLMQHVFILGQSGVGKTVAASLLMFQQIQRGGGVMFVDGKLDAKNIESMYHYCCWCGRQQDFMVINPGDPEHSNTYNPVLNGDADEVSARILLLIPSTENNPGADHYKQEANQGLVTLISGLQAAGWAYTMIDLSVLLTNGRALQDLERKLINVAPRSEAAKNFRLFLDKFRIPANDKNGQGGEIDMVKLKNTFGGVGGRLFVFGTGKFGEIMNTYTPDVDMYDAMRKNRIIYVALPTMGKSMAAQNFGKIVVGDMRTAVSWIQALPEDDRPNPPFLCFFDEAGAYIGESWPRIFEQARSAKLILMPAVQTFANFKAVSEELAEMVTGNTWIKLFFKIGTHVSALEAAELIGMEMAKIKTLTDSTSQSLSAQFLKADPDFSGSAGSGLGQGEREQEEYRVSADHLKALDRGQCIMTYGGKDLYDIRVPMIKVSAEMAKRFGPVRLNRFRREFRQGANFFDDKVLDRLLKVDKPEKSDKGGKKGKGRADDDNDIDGFDDE